ncbi:hypothetical protein PISMIDRAFT_616437 [Pisolithus microcarpus 441]|uniref:Uncharacterized protein n=1 Tax=Pisolithus microcarpus 441 TaxID=765257 RepID=A0A0C9Z134_9AGAM|nr:hypothetical protein BKA83DRAFT_616437 [Pisolithus microcarpus]KIK19979.1 hypothetical protein PISMIDRAFT_616437 [Pisolithus microcarpus 441]
MLAYHAPEEPPQFFLLQLLASGLEAPSCQCRPAMPSFFLRIQHSWGDMACRQYPCHLLSWTHCWVHRGLDMIPCPYQSAHINMNTRISPTGKSFHEQIFPATGVLERTTFEWDSKPLSVLFLC